MAWNNVDLKIVKIWYDILCMYNCIFWHFIASIACALGACNMDGSKDGSCDDKGKCTCQDNYDGQKCEKCKQGYEGFPKCVEAGNFLHFQSVSSRLL